MTRSDVRPVLHLAANTSGVRPQAEGAAPPARPALLAAGLALLAALWGLPLERWMADFPAFMLRHMGLVALAAPLLVLGLPRLAGLLAINPLLAAVLEFLAVWGWHTPRLHGLARLEPWALLLEQGTFLLVGLFVWSGCLRAAQPLAGAGGLLLTSMHMTLLGALLTLAPRDLYFAFCGTLPDLSGQQLGGMMMLAIGTPVYLVAGLWLTARALQGGSTP
ncbi:cytochrome c oxidase assembly protein [Pseudoroseicyclus tamaricis]|uniref:Cytochrome c oxidase assembly protein n=1 Tax=Pseudoroseicyclus tamaricis TaxID=2705421 RepID=A0A6B2JNN2_9RHOB|nr:cytochrome c oxidase assembly protein [Pseudoroseicyclus tamaricis]NDV00297.1 cytochrome c oxidase assembly protein [Pseudoroseicyclus tamaricis]